MYYAFGSRTKPGKRDCFPAARFLISASYPIVSYDAEARKSRDRCPRESPSSPGRALAFQPDGVFFPELKFDTQVSLFVESHKIDILIFGTIVIDRQETGGSFRAA